MSILSLRLPDSLHEEIKKLSKNNHISINQFITTAVSEKLTALVTEEYLKQRADQGNVKDFFNVLDKVKDIPPDDVDKP